MTPTDGNEPLHFLEPQLQTWNISEKDFPSKDSTADKLRFMLNYAVLAPSGHNTQPWLFKIIDDGIEIYADGSRALPVVDPDDRELIISCGAALSHLQLAMRHFGYADKTAILPEENSDLIARVTIAGRNDSQQDDPLFSAITMRRTNRSPFEDRAVQTGLLQSFLNIAKEHGAWFDIVEGDKKKTVADLVSEGDRIQMSDKKFRRELAAWIHPNRSHSRDGMPGYAHGMPDLASNLGPFLIRTFDIGKGQAAKDKQLAAGSPVLAILGTAGDKARDWIHSGQSIGKILLRARVDGVWTSFLNQPIEVAELRSKLRDVTGRNNGFPQLLVRMGYGKEVKPTPRRDVESVIASV